LSVLEFHQLFVADSSTFSYDFHLQRGDQDISVELWSLKDGKYVRTISYDAPTSSSALVQRVAGASIKLTETHYYYYTNSNTDFVLEIHIKDEAARFLVVIKEVVTTQNEGVSINVTCTMQYNGYFSGAVEELMLRFAGKLVNVYTQFTNQTVQIYLQQKRLAAPIQEFIARSDGGESDTEYFELEEDDGSFGLEEIKDSLIAEVKQLANAAQMIEARVAAMERALYSLQDSQQTTFQSTTQEQLDQYKKRRELLSPNMQSTTTPGQHETEKTDGFNLLTAGLIGGTVIVWPIVAISAWNFASKFLTK